MSVSVRQAILGVLIDYVSPAFRTMVWLKGLAVHWHIKPTSKIWGTTMEGLATTKGCLLCELGWLKKFKSFNLFTPPSFRGGGVREKMSLKSIRQEVGDSHMTKFRNSVKMAFVNFGRKVPEIPPKWETPCSYQIDFQFSQWHFKNPPQMREWVNFFF